MLRCSGSVCSTAPDPAGDVDFSIALADADDTLSDRLTLKSVAVVSRPAGESSLNFLFQTVRIPLNDFAGVDLETFRGVRFEFDQTAASSIYLGNVRLTRTKAGPGGLPPISPPIIQSTEKLMAQTSTDRSSPPDVNRILAIRSIDTQAAAARAGLTGPAVEIELTSSRPFPMGGALPMLLIGKEKFTLSRFPPGTTDRLIFTLSGDEFAKTRRGAPVRVTVGGADPWEFGELRR
jgi:hypothetical protein